MIIISILRKQAFKRLTLSTTEGNYMAILQIFESTDDVVNYMVGEIDKNFQHKDKFLPDMRGFAKWIPISVVEN